MPPVKNWFNHLMPLLFVAVVAAVLWLTGDDNNRPAWLFGATLAGVGSGCLALALLRPQRAGLSPPNVMLGLGLGGMLAGLLIDLSKTPLAVIEALCRTTVTGGFAEAMLFHASMLPAMHLLMVVGGLAAIPALRVLRPECRRLCSLLTQNALCSTWMLVGMTGGATLFAQSVSSLTGLALNRMLGGMFTGMVWGMVVSVCAYRLFFIARDHLVQRHLPERQLAHTED
ncbi:MAG: hypothetical protein NBV65_13370 [Burkholderiaceae bacterium]|nr:hypothetical protein [Burkholderiaceae bacterium]